MAITPIVIQDMNKLMISNGWRRLKYKTALGMTPKQIVPPPKNGTTTDAKTILTNPSVLLVRLSYQNVEA
jgi:hypothetical protein